MGLGVFGWFGLLMRLLLVLDGLGPGYASGFGCFVLGELFWLFGLDVLLLSCCSSLNFPGVVTARFCYLLGGVLWVAVFGSLGFWV